MKIYHLKLFVLAFFYVVTTSHVIASENDKWGGYVEIFGKPGSERSLAKGDFFLPLYQTQDYLLFTNIRATFDDDSNREGSIGLGARRLLDNWIVGGYGYFDLRESSNDNTFTQGTVGFELLSEEWDFRINGYITEKEEERVDDLNVIEINGNQVQARFGQERALPGMDVEVGRKLPVLEDTRIFVGGFHYDANDFDKVSGPKARLETRFHDVPVFSSAAKGTRITLGIEYSDDSLRGSQIIGLLQLRVPFGAHTKVDAPKLTALERRMMESVVRDDDIIISENIGDELFAVNNPLTGQVISFADTIDANTADVSGTVAAAGQNSLIVADGSQGIIDVGANTISASPGQIIVGGGQTVNLQADGQTIPFTPTGQMATINSTGFDDLIRINTANNVTVSGISLQGGRPLHVRNSSNVLVTNVTVNSSAANVTAVRIEDNSNITINDLTVNSAGGRGVEILTASTVNFENTNIMNAGSEGVIINGGSSAILNDVSISNTGEEGLRITNGSFVIADNLFVTRSNREAIEVNTSSMLTLMNSRIQDIDVSPSARGIFVLNNAIANLSNVSIDNVASNGLEVIGNSTVNASNLMISNTDLDGINVINSTLSLDNSTIRDIGNGGGGDDAVHAFNATLSGDGNSIQGNVDGQDCRDLGGNTGSIGFTSGPITSCP